MWKFEIVFVHVAACARYLIITHVREVKGSAKTKKRTEMRALKKVAFLKGAIKKEGIVTLLRCSPFLKLFS